ncbi:MAG: hypothetical protein IIC09_06970, partial [Proteobacteria bacterium]|nr:hypothetical protein [Pseudomonadota bacterium]
MKASDLFIRCLENEGVEYIFGIPGEENLDVMDSMIGSTIKFLTTRHEQGAAFMADVYGRLTGKAGVCLATLGPGATNLVTGFADANMDHAPIIGIAGQGATTRMHKESHQILDLVNLFAPISKYSVQIREPEIVGEIVRKAFKAAEAEKPGGCFIDFPENIAAMQVEGKEPLKVQSAKPPVPPQDKISQAAEIISNARYPLVMAGNGVVRADANDALVAFAEKLNIPVATTFMAKGSIPFSHDLSLGTVGLQAQDYIACGFDRADVVICVGYDMIEYHPHLWNQEKTSKIIHIDMSPAEVDEHYILECGVIGDINAALKGIAAEAVPKSGSQAQTLREIIVEELTADSLNGVDFALFSAGSDISRAFAKSPSAGTVVIDNSSAFRMDPAVPLVIPEINPGDIAKHDGIIANPNCSTILLVMALKPLHDLAGIRRVVVATYQSTS